MGRPEPCVLFSQTFVHPHLDEYIDEVLFAEPVVVTACEFLEQNASSACQSVTLVGATSPPSFALEVFVQCEGESRFRRLCQPFLYSHSSSNVLDVEAVVTNHLVARGSYRSLSLVVYGNTAEDLGQFNIEFDDSSLTNIVSSVEGDLEDLPLPLRSINFINDKFTCSLHALSVPVSVLDISLEVKQLLELILKILEVQKSGGAVQKAVNTFVSAASAYIIDDLSSETIHQKYLPWCRIKETAEFQNEINRSRTELIELYKVLQQESGDTSTEPFQESVFLGSDINLHTSKQLVDMFGQYFHFGYESSSFGHPSLSKSKNVMLWLSVALFLCSSKESCYHFVNSGGIEQLMRIFCHDLPKSTTAVLLLLGVLEQSTRHSVGCERFLGWWPREDETVPSGISEGYSQLLRLLLEKPRHDVASLASYVLRRLRAYEVLARYECAVLSALGHHCTDDGADISCLDLLMTAKSQLKNLVKLVNSRGSIEDPSLVARSSRSLMLGQSEGSLSYKATSGLITSSNSCLFTWDSNLHLLALLKERGFWPLSVAMLSLSTLHSEVGNRMFLNMEIMISIGAVLFSFLLSRSGLLFLAHQAELSDALIEALKGADSARKDCLPLPYASTLISKGFFCRPREIGMILEMHLRVVNVIDHLLTSTPHSEEFLWVLWELCAFSRSDCGRKALLIFGYFPEAMSALIEALRSVKEPEPAAKSAGASPLDVAIFHSAAEIFEFIVTDSTPSSLGSWIGYAVELHGALHSSSPGSNRKDAPTRLLEWIDAGVVYHKIGAVGLLRYAAVLASGGNAHLTSTSVLVSDLMDVEHSVGDPSGGSEINVMENLGKIISEKTFDGVVLRDSAIAQLTTAFRILAFISENSTVASELYDEGAISVMYAVLVNCRFMLERSSNSYDYLVDDGTECNSTSDLLLERNREQSLVDLLVPAMVLLVSLLHKLQEANEQHRNTKLMNALLRLHKEVSPKLAACAADLCSPYPDSALGFEAVCHLVVSALAYWPVLGWTPGLFHSLLTNVQATSALALGPKELCSLLCLLNDLFPEEDIWLWRNGMPALSALRRLAIGSILGPQKEREVNWYLKPEHHDKVLCQLRPHLDKIAEMIQHCAISALVVIQDMLRVLIVRIACQKVENASILIRPILSWVLESVGLSFPSETDAYKIRRYLDFLASLLEHPQAKALLLKEGIVTVLHKGLERCLDVIDSAGSDVGNWASPGFTMSSWCLPVLKSVSLICGSGKPEQYSVRYDSQSSAMSSGDCALVLPSLLKCFQVLPFGKELLACVGAFKELGSSAEGRSALLDTFFHVHSKTELHDSNKGQERKQIIDHKESRWTRYPPLLCCWKKLWSSFVSRDDMSVSAVEGLRLLSTGCSYFCRDGKNLDLKGFSVVKYLFGLSEDIYTADGSLEENMNYIKGVATFLTSKIRDRDHGATSMQTSLYQVLKPAESLLSLLQKPSSDIDTVDVSSEAFPPLSSEDSISPKVHLMGGANSEKGDDILLSGGLVDKFLWDCPETLPDKAALPMKRKLSSGDGAGRRGRAENSAADSTTASGTFSRGSGPVVAPPGPTRRDTFRLRKPNTSRPPSMHVDDYVARERNADGGSDVIAIPRGSTSGRPPSIHVDEFMARQRERQSSSATVVGEVKNAAAAAPPIGAALEKVDKHKQLKTDLDDDLQGIDIVFDGEESESDDELPFPQLDENLQLSAPVIAEQNSPRSVVEDTESDTHESGQFSRMGTPTASNADENAQSDFSSRMSASRIERSLTREQSVTSDKKFDPPNDHIAKSSGYASAMYNSGSSGRARVDSRMSPQTSYPKQSPQHSGNHPPFNVASQGPYDPTRYMHTQPPLPPMPPPPTVSSVIPHSDSQSNTGMDGKQHIPATFQVQQDYLSAYNNSSSGSVRPLPPLPPTPPPFLSNPYNVKTPSMQSAPYGLYPPTPLMAPMLYNRPPQSLPMSSSYMNSPMMQQQQQQLGENPSQNLQTMHSLTQLQPLQPPLLPPQPPPHHHRPPQSSVPMHGSPSLQMLHQQQPPFPPPVNTFYQSQQPESSHSQSLQQVEQPPQQQKDTGISLADYFKSPEDIQALLSDREKLCQLLEQHPKLMQMLQEKLGQL